MSVEDDTFDIDLYGDDDDVQPEAQPAQNNDDTAATEEVLDGANDQVNNTTASSTSTLAHGEIGTTESSQTVQESQPLDVATPTAATPAQQGTKRKAEDDGDRQPSTTQDPDGDYQEDTRPIDPAATPALKLAELHWWTTEEDVRGICARAAAEEELVDISFGEHKINGKSKGEAYLEFSSLQASTAVKKEIEAASQVKGENGVKKSPFVVFFTQGGNPFKGGAAGPMGKKDFSSSSSGGMQNGGGVGRGGAYNNSGHNRGGGFGGRGGGGGFNNNRGGGGYGRGGMMQHTPTPPQQGGWGMNGNVGGMGGMGGYVNPMMAGYGGMGMGFGGMNRGGGMMNGNAMGMMGRGGGGFGGMGMGMGGMGMNMGGMGGRGGGGMMGRGGWGGGNAGGGFQQNFGGGGGGFNGGGMQGQGQGQQGNKRAKME